MSCIQLELFERPEIEIVKSEVRNLENALGNVRRGMFSRHDELEKKYKESRVEMEKLKDAICLMQEQMKNYERALFPVSEFAGGMFLGAGGDSSTSLPVSTLMISSHASSTGLSLPKK